MFYGCSNYPECKYVSWEKPIEEACPECGVQLAERKLNSGQVLRVCPNAECPSNANKKKRKKASADATMQKAAQQAAKKIKKETEN